MAVGQWRVIFKMSAQEEVDGNPLLISQSPPVSMSEPK